MKRTFEALDGQWLFQIDRDEQGEARGYHQPGYWPEGWLKVSVPSNWDTYLPELFGYAGHAWYPRTFRPQAAWRGGRIHLRFEGANYETVVWLNGRLVGSHSGGFDPFEFDVTAALDWEGENTLSVRVDNWPRVGRVPNALAGWWNYGGIYRSLKLLALPVVRLADVFVRAEPGRGLTVGGRGDPGERGPGARRGRGDRRGVVRRWAGRNEWRSGCPRDDDSALGYGQTPARRRDRARQAVVAG